MSEEQDPMSRTGMFRSIRDVVREEVKPIKALMTGPEGEPHKGFIIRMDRVERICKMLVWGLTLIITAFAFAGIADLVKRIFGS